MKEKQPIKGIKEIFEDILSIKQRVDKGDFWVSKDELIKYAETLKSLVKTIFQDFPVKVYGPRPRTELVTAFEISVSSKVQLSKKSVLRIKLVLDWGKPILYATLETTDRHGIPDKDFYEWKIKTSEDIEKISRFVRELKIKCSLLD